MIFENEHLFPGQAGHFLILLAFVASIVSAWSFFKAGKAVFESERHSWLKLARTVFYIEFISLAAVFALLYYICSQHLFEYLYAYKHASLELEPKYLLACIWEGQEGSFLLWSLWHCVLGCVVILTAKKHESAVMTIVNTAQFFLILMLLGIYVGDARIGNSPFVLTRNELIAPIFSQSDYLSRIPDGIGLNVLLRNYWMVIHPPVLFLGFASTLIPVGFAYSALSKKDWGGWIRPVLPWVLFACLVLGVGIMMGGKWAYESLSFGGYWAWDPVENASLVPWIILVAGLHCMLIYRSTRRALRASFLFTLLAYLFVLYSTFLTRTGILGNTSVHSFTEAGTVINILIGIYVLGITVPMFIMYFRNYSRIPAIQKEENISAREFWMFIGSLVLLLSALFIIGVTSLPVYNKVLGTNLADPPDREFTYNKVLVLVAVIIGLLTGAAQYLKYRNTGRKYFNKRIIWPLLAAIVIAGLLAVFYPLQYAEKGPGFLIAIYLALFAAIFSVVANGAYLFTVLKGNLKAGGSAIAHVGFALMLTGMLISSSNKKVISDNRVTGFFIPFEEDPTGRSMENPMENLTLIKGVPTPMGKYVVTYVRDSASPTEATRTYYKLRFVQKDSATREVEDVFMLAPDSYRMKDNTLSSNPATRHYFTHDVFTYVSTISIDDPESDTATFRTHEMLPGDSVFYNEGYIVLDSIIKNPDFGKFHFLKNDTALAAEITVFSNKGTSYKSYPALQIHDMSIHFLDDTVITQDLHMRFSGISASGKFKIGIKENDKPTKFITLKAFIFPYVNLVWAGLVIMALGFIVSLFQHANAAKIVSRMSILLVVGALVYLFLFANA